jgi:hypothetical protein
MSTDKSSYLENALEIFQAATPPTVPEWTESVCEDGAAILCDGTIVPIEKVVAELNRLTECSAALERLLALVKPKYTEPDEILAVMLAIHAAKSALAKAEPLSPVKTEGKQ